MKELRVVNRFFLKYRRHLILGVLFVLLSNYFRVLQPQAVRQALDLVYDQVRLHRLFAGYEASAQHMVAIGQSLLYFGVLVLVLALFMGFFMYYTRQTIIVMSRLIEYDMRKQIYAHYQEMSQAFFRRNRTGDLMARISEDVNKVRMYLGPAVLYGINLVTLFVLVIGAMFAVNAELSMYCLLPLPLLSLSIYFVSSVIHRKSTIIQQQLAKLNTIAQEVFSGIRVVKSYARESLMKHHFADQCESYKIKSLKLATVNALFFPLMLLIIGSSTIITIFFGGLQVAKGAVTPGNIAEFVIYVNMLTWPVTSIGWIASIIQQAEASQKRINEFLGEEADIKNTGYLKPDLLGKIEFDKVSLLYEDTNIEALKGCSFTLEAGKKMAIVGKTGSGKTTIADMLLRMLEPTEGKILLDGVDLRAYDLTHLRRRIGYVPQDVFLFSDTVSHNIQFGMDDQSGEEIARHYAAKAAVYDDIMTLTDGFDTRIGERGVTLSGGQKQRVAMARAFAKEPDLIILDDCLSAVDTTTENQILSYLNEALAGKTALIITHRIYGLLQFDQIIVLDEGRIVEQGTHEELLEQRGFYAKMYERQQLTEVQNDEFWK